jgi:crotonobetainyl-CoA:carnitine CoA-transferase CaiB-like acyl-CoA transferase
VADGVLGGLRVLDFTWVVAGPVATRALADLGAEVIRVERRDSTDFGDRRGGLSGTLMRGKRSIVLNLADPRGVALARRLALQSDVIIDNFSARVMPNLGLDWETLSRERPDVICVRMTGYGLDGPRRDHVSYGPTLQALTGYSLLMTEPGRDPAGFGYSYADLAGGHFGTLAVLAAVFRRTRTGEGALVDLSQLESVAALLGPVVLERALDGAVSTPFGNASQEAPAAPHGIYRCAGDDHWIAITIFGDADWQRLVDVIGRPAWSERFASEAARLADRGALDAALSAWTRTQDAGEIMHRLQAAGVGAGHVADARQLCAEDPQLAHRGYFVQVDTPEGKTVRVDSPPYLLSDTPGRPRGAGPLLGEHTDQVLRDVLGITDDEIAELRAERVVA